MDRLRASMKTKIRRAWKYLQLWYCLKQILFKPFCKSGILFYSTTASDDPFNFPEPFWVAYPLLYVLIHKIYAHASDNFKSILESFQSYVQIENRINLYRISNIDLIFHITKLHITKCIIFYNFTSCSKKNK